MLKTPDRESFFAALQSAGISEAQTEFSVAPAHQLVSKSLLEEIADFIRVFDTVTGREAWRTSAQRRGAAIAQMTRKETCFFSAWDFHVPPNGGSRLIEFNDSGAGFLLAALINALYCAAGGLNGDAQARIPPPFHAFEKQIGDFAEAETRAFFGERPAELLLILDDEESLRHGKFRSELRLLCELMRRRGWRAELGAPAETRWDGRRLLFAEQAVAFVINRSTDFLWRGADCSALRTAYEAGGVYIAPNPFSYVTRSDKQLLEWLSLPHRDAELGIKPDERRILDAHVPETHVLQSDNVDMLAQRKNEFVFKPAQSFGGRGLLDSASVGRARLRRLCKRDEKYVAQRRVPKARTEIDGVVLWTDIRVWAYRGEIFLISGRASRNENRLDLAPPGGWLPTYPSR